MSTKYQSVNGVLAEESSLCWEVFMEQASLSHD